jgi:hypothetical protein
VSVSIGVQNLTHALEQRPHLRAKQTVIFSACFAFAAANAQLPQSDSPKERDDRAAALPPTPGPSLGSAASG